MWFMKMVINKIMHFLLPLCHITKRCFNKKKFIACSMNTWIKFYDTPCIVSTAYLSKKRFKCKTYCALCY